jgi:hypothetical protein
LFHVDVVVVRVRVVVCTQGRCEIGGCVLLERERESKRGESTTKTPSFLHSPMAGRARQGCEERRDADAPATCAIRGFGRA